MVGTTVGHDLFFDFSVRVTEPFDEISGDDRIIVFHFDAVFTVQDIGIPVQFIDVDHGLAVAQGT